MSILSLQTDFMTVHREERVIENELVQNVTKFLFELAILPVANQSKDYRASLKTQIRPFLLKFP
ncbi:hypothetical protein Hs30E_01850 [Lactococcus hodotermopsidis]|uniref:Uncharacterized protein n=2 Tax=Pseudolactococcus hodotermopsidis TaxID=2709157 RepID=A0A6A0BB89_9LACT|nr:hypothetical protein Hs30E_01850 [Lactococcus hodotermopsidis]